MSNVQQKLRKHYTLQNFVTWIGDKTALEVYEQCPNGLWLMEVVYYSKKITKKTAIKIAISESKVVLVSGLQEEKRRDALFWGMQAVLAKNALAATWFTEQIVGILDAHNRAKHTKYAQAENRKYAEKDMADRIRSAIPPKEKARIIAWLGGES